MKIRTFTIGILFWLIAITTGVAQETNPTLERLLAAKEQVIQDEKDALKIEVEVINARLANKEITAETAEVLKKDAAEKRAMNIENKVAILDNKIALLERNGALNSDGETIGFKLTLGDVGDENHRVFTVGKNTTKTRELKYDERTYSRLVIAAGLNNTIADGRSLDDSPYRIGGSKFAEIGISWSTRVFKESNWLRFTYGLSYQLNGLKLENNQFLVENGNQTVLQEFPEDLDKQKLRMDNLVVPVYFEFGPSKKITGKDYFRYNTYRSFKVGLGGYAGLNVSTLQKLKFDTDGNDIKQKERANFNTNNFIYGLGAYVGVGSASVYLKYDLNSIFKNNPLEEHNVSLGLRWDFD